ncbi:MAG: pitrilysin family protein [Aestuariivirgaceae bacterium]|jgi:zinc protease
MRNAACPPPRLKQLTVALAALAAVAMTAVAPARALNIEVARFTLGNGMQVVVIPDRRAPVVTQMVWYKVGAADEPQGKAGIAHFLEHLMFKGTPQVPAGEFSRIVRRHGGEDNAFTSQDFTAYYQRISKDRLDLVMGLEADRMRNLQLTDAAVLPEREVIKEERRQRTDNDPANRLGEQLDAALYLAHPYGKPVIGWMSEMSQLNRDDAIGFYRQHYTPSNAVLVVAGDVDPSEVKALADKHFGVLPNSAQPQARIRTSEPEPVASRRVTLADPQVATPMVQRAYLAPSYRTAKPGEAEALEVLAEVLGGNSTSRLYRGLVVNHQVAAQAGASYSGENLDSGNFVIYATPVPGGTNEAAEAALDSELDRLAREGTTEDEVARARNRLLADTVYSLDSQFRLAYLFGAALTSGRTVEDVLSWDERVRKVTKEDVDRVARAVLQLNRSVTGVLIKSPGGADAKVAN